MRHYKALLTSIMAMFIVVVFLMGSSVQALSGIWTRGYQIGYFDLEYANHQCFQWRYGYQNCYLFPDGIPGSVGSVATFYQFIQDNYYSGNYQLYTSAAYVVHSMLGQPQGTTGRPVSNAQWADLLARLNYVASYGGIHWDDANSTGEDGGLDSQSDVYIAQSGQVDQSIVFYAPNGAKIYALFRPCGNPDGSLTNGLPSLNYTLEPILNMSPSGGGGSEPGTPISLTGTVKNDGPTPTGGNTNFDMDTFTLPPNSNAVLNGSYQYGTGSPESFYGHGARSVGTGAVPPIGYPGAINAGGWPPQFIPENAVAGEQICYAFSIQPAQSSNMSNWRYGVPQCVLVGKRPLVDVLGGDVRQGVGSSVTTTVAGSTVYDGTTGRVYGSWVEYGLLAAGKITGMTSGGYDAYTANQTGVPGANSDSPDTQCSFDRLTFSNNKCPTTLGNYTDAGNLQPISTVSAAFKTSQAPPASITPSSLTSGTVYGTAATGTYTVNGATLGKGDWTVINVPNATVEIKSNITYDATANLQNLSDIPQLVIIAKNIYIDPGVTNVDSWLYASNAMFTCAINGTATAAGDVSNITTATSGANGCGNQLVVHGPVSAGHLYMWRSPEGGQGYAGEVFDLRADSYLWAYNQARANQGLSTLSTAEKPPRF